MSMNMAAQKGGLMLALSGKQAWHLVDARRQVVGRLASKIVNVLRGKHKPTFECVEYIQSDIAQGAPARARGLCGGDERARHCFYG